jgi:hypothetical protein
MIMTVSDKLTKSFVGTVVSICTTVFLIFLFVDDRYFHSAAADDMQVQVSQLLKEQMTMQKKFYVDEQRINDQRQLDQLRCSKSLLESELVRNPNDRLIKENLDRISNQIKFLEDKLNKPPQY